MTVLLMWLLGSLSFEAYAQEAIKALISKCETLESVDINIVRTRDRDTKEVTHSVINIQIHTNPSLVKEFQDAFQKIYEADATMSKDLGDREIITRRGGKIVNLLYKYGNVSYSFSVEDGGQSANLSVIERAKGDDMKRNGKEESFIIHPEFFNGLNLPGDLNLFFSIPDFNFHEYSADMFN
ncbi:MAG: DUF5024 domain-containing protein [Tannerella sp.]|nr:DUF5024 domain-containing protein [Tannerella sp.]